MNTKTGRRPLTTLFVLLVLFIAAANYAFAARNPRLGELDPSFDPVILNSTINSFTVGNGAYMNAVLVQPDGKVLFAGFFVTVDRQSRNYIVRLNADGTPDTTFDSGGTVDGMISSMALQADGRILVAGTFLNVAGQPLQGVARLNADGSFDPTFRVSSTGTSSAVAVQADGKVLFTRSSIVRVNADGSTDATFTAPAACTGSRITLQPDGKVLTNSPCQTGSTGIARLNSNGTLDATFTPGTGTGGSSVDAIVLQGDGKILIGGQFTTFNGQSHPGFTRLNANGSLDATFNAPVIASFQSQAITIQSDGKILAARRLSSIGGTDNSILRFNTDGTLDGTFNAGASAFIYTIAAAQDGRIYAGGKMTVTRNAIFTEVPVLRFSATGAFDDGFDPFIACADDSRSVNNVVVQPDGRVLVRGQISSVNRQKNPFLARLNADGTLDPTFTLAANVSIIAGEHSDNALALQPDGKILVNGTFSGGPANNIIRLNSDGTLDSSFSLAGGANLSINRIALQPDGRVLVAGPFTSIGGQARAGFARLNANGTVDSFNPNGGQPLSIRVQPDGKFVASNITSVSGTPRNGNARFNADGTLDTTFANTNLGGGLYLAMQPDGKFIVEEGGFIVRVNADNTSDSTFTPVTLLVTVNSQGTVSTASVQPDGKILLGGNFFYVGGFSLPPHANIVRLNANGSVDQTLINYGGASGNFTAAAAGGAVFQISQQPDGKVLLAGQFRTFNGFGRSGVARLNPAVTQANRIADLDGDGRSDLAILRPATGTWYMLRSTAGFTAVQFGLTGDKLTPADFDGDGKTDIAIWREQAADPVYYTLQSTTSTVALSQFGQTGDIATVTGDWDGDGKADAAVYRNAASGSQSYFYYRGSLNNPSGNITYIAWGTDGDKPVRGDFDGDGRLDAAVFRPSTGTFYIRQSSNGQAIYRTFGLATDKIVNGDFDGDGKDDVAVFRPSNGFWYIWQSASNQIRYQQFGLGTDTLVPADYDGDGRTDIAVYRSGVWIILQSSDNQTRYFNFGTTGDVPVEGAFIQ